MKINIMDYLDDEEILDGVTQQENQKGGRKMKVYGLCREFSPQYYVDGYLTYPSQMKDYLEGLDTKPWTIIRLDIGQHEFDKLQEDNKKLRKRISKLEERIEFLEDVDNGLKTRNELEEY